MGRDQMKFFIKKQKKIGGKFARKRQAHTLTDKLTAKKKDLKKKVTVFDEDGRCEGSYMISNADMGERTTNKAEIAKVHDKAIFAWEEDEDSDPLEYVFIKYKNIEKISSELRRRLSSF